MRRSLSTFADIHSHDLRKACDGSTVVSLSPGDEMLPGGNYSVGIHPWDTVRPVTLSQLKSLVAMARDSRVVAIGECGIDRLRGGDIEYQTQVFDFQLRLAARLHLPVIIHAVKADDILIAAIRRYRPSEPWIIHGFRGGEQRALQLLRHGFSLSLGRRYNPAAASLIPADRFYHETDEDRNI